MRDKNRKWCHRNYNGSSCMSKILANIEPYTSPYEPIYDRNVARIHIWRMINGTAALWAIWVWPFSITHFACKIRTVLLSWTVWRQWRWIGSISDHIWSKWRCSFNCCIWKATNATRRPTTKRTLRKSAEVKFLLCILIVFCCLSVISTNQQLFQTNFKLILVILREGGKYYPKLTGPS